MTATTLEPLREGRLRAVSASRWLSLVSHLEPKYGGLSAAVPQMAREVTRTGAAEVSLAGFCVAGEEAVPEGFAGGGLSHWPTSRMLWLRDRGLRARLGAEIRAVDGVHVHGLWEQSTAVACGLARAMRRPYVLSAHGMLEPWALQNKRLKKLLYAAAVERGNVRGAACLHALTRNEARAYREFGARGPVAVIPNAVRVPAGASGELFLGEFPALRGRRVVLFLGRLHPKKGLDLLVPAWAAAARRYPEAVLVVAGPDFAGTRAGIEALVGEYGLGGQVVFAGMLGEAMKGSALAAAECFVLPSRSEGLSMAALEAMGAGVPVVVTEPCNMPEVGEIGAGWEVAASVDGLTGALGEMLGQTAAANAAMGARGAARIAERHGWATVARQMAAVYGWVLGGPVPADVEVLRG